LLAHSEELPKEYEGFVEAFPALVRLNNGVSYANAVTPTVFLTGGCWPTDKWDREEIVLQR
jgi:hypothetical protein